MEPTENEHIEMNNQQSAAGAIGNELGRSGDPSSESDPSTQDASTAKLENSPSPKGGQVIGYSDSHIMVKNSDGYTLAVPTGARQKVRFNEMASDVQLLHLI